MTLEEWIEEFFYKAAELGKYTELHDRVSEMSKVYPNSKFHERVEMAYKELTQENQNEVEVSDI
jgi:hypothetical protein